MLEYPIDEATELLRRNLETATTSLQQTEEDIDFVKDQCTTLEVGILTSSLNVSTPLLNRLDFQNY